MCVLLFFFFFKQKTAYDMRISDWSSDVCSSDLLDALASAGGTKEPIGKLVVQLTRGGNVTTMPLDTVIRDPKQNIRLAPDDVEIGRASCRERVCQYV